MQLRSKSIVYIIKKKKKKKKKKKERKKVKKGELIYMASDILAGLTG